MIVIRLQTIFAREVAPGESAVLTVGSIQAGSKSNVIPDRAELQLNIRTYSRQTRTTMLDAIRRIVTAECQASGSPREPEFEVFDQYPLTDNDLPTTSRVSDAFTTFFGEGRCQTLPMQTASEDFSDIPTALDAPYNYWFIGGISLRHHHHLWLLKFHVQYRCPELRRYPLSHLMSTRNFLTSVSHS